ncbi:hypothetical protein HK098_000339 [Nowakowskiella sp. JEL0407]|nr:hypothetical protein HK098_000339 [Nowakowskiella sp. JEL0407]
MFLFRISERYKAHSYIFSISTSLVLDKVSEFLKVAESNKDTPEATQDLGIIIDCQDEDENKESDSSNESNDDDNDSENELSDSDSDSEMNSPCDDKQIIEMNIGLGVFDCIPISDQNETTGGGEEREVINEQTIKIPTTRSQDILDSKNLIEMME